MHGMSALSCTCCIGGRNFFQILRFKKLYAENKKLYGSHLIFDQFVKF